MYLACHTEEEIVEMKKVSIGTVFRAISSKKEKLGKTPPSSLRPYKVIQQWGRVVATPTRFALSSPQLPNVPNYDTPTRLLACA